MTNEIFIKFLNNQCTDGELDEVIRWVNTKAFNDEGESWKFDDWELYQEQDNSGDEEKFSLLFDKIQHKINIDNQNHKITESRTLALPVVTTWLTRAAAVLFIPALAFLFYTLSEMKMESIKYANLTVDSLEIIAPVGSRTVVQLSDGSEVHLNYGSKIKYPQFFSGDTREIILSGEGYFDIAHNPEKPFIVKTWKLNVKALGTALNVLAYPGDDAIETTLVNGKVVLEQNELNGKTKIIGAMVPGQHVKYNIKTGKFLCTEGSLEKYIAWKDGKLVFKDTPITQVAERLSRMFNVDIGVTDEIKNHIYTVTFVNETLFQILDLMTMATSVRYKALPQKKLPDGTFSKQKIIIEKKQ